MKNGITTIIQWAGSPVHHFEKLGYGKTKFCDLEKTNWFFDRCLMLPLHMALLDDEINYIIDKIKEFYND